MGRKAANTSITLEAVLGILKDRLPELQQTYGVRSLGVFSSYVRGESRATSDLDVLVEFDRAPTFFQFVRLERMLAELLGIKVDLVMKSALNPEIGKHILDEVVPV